jgi:poly-gamma-glutamate synthesis protein (capsule biosynthesis protein)
MEQRRARRAALEKKKRLEQQRLRRKLILAAAIFAVCFGMVLWLTWGTGSAGQSNLPGETFPEQPGFTVPPEEEATLPPETPTTTIHIRAAGDLNITDKVVASGKAKFGDYYDYTNAFLDVAPLLSDADLTLLNFEGNLVGPPYGTETASAPVELVQALANSGVDILQMANSYSIYNGMIGLTQTLNNIRATGIEPVGAFATPSEFQQSKGYTICDIQGVKVAVVAFTKGMSSFGLPSGSESCVNKLFVDYDSEYKKIDYDGIRSIMKDLRSEKPDLIIAMLHWGAEYNDTVFESQEDIAELMLKEGVDVILGTHSHMVHRIDFDREENTLVAYSLGDFFGDAAKSGTAYSFILDIQVTRDNEMGTTRIDDFTVLPIYTLSEADGNGRRRVVRIEECIAAYEVNFVDKVTKSAREAMDYALERIEARIATPHTVECPQCETNLEILVNKDGKLVADKACGCGKVLEAGSNYSDYD